MRIYKLYSAASTATNSAAVVTIQQSGRITFLSSLVALAVTGLGQGMGHELSFASVAQQSVNDTIGPVLENRAMVTGLTTGAGNGSFEVNQAGISVPVSRGDRIYLNVFAHGTAPGAFVNHVVFIHVT
jgi:hypothetical protein